MSKPTLKPCPCCGYKNPRFIFISGPYPHKVDCPQCGLRTGGSAYESNEYNANQWNKRAKEDALEARIKELEALLEQLLLK